MIQYEGYTLEQLEVAAGGGAKRRFKRIKSKLSGTLIGTALGGITGGLLGFAKDSSEDGGGATEVPEEASTTTQLGTTLEGPSGGTFDEDEEARKRAAVNKAKLGTRGLRIPLASDASTTTSNTAAGTGVQI